MQAFGILKKYIFPFKSNIPDIFSKNELGGRCLMVILWVFFGEIFMLSDIIPKWHKVRFAHIWIYGNLPLKCRSMKCCFIFRLLFQDIFAVNLQIFFPLLPHIFKIAKMKISCRCICRKVSPGLRIICFFNKISCFFKIANLKVKI